MKTKLSFGLLMFAASLSGCAHADPEREPDASDGSSRKVVETPRIRTIASSESVAGSVREPETKYGKDGLPEASGVLRFSLIEFSTDEKQALDASLLALDEGKNEAEGKRGALFESLLASARSGESAIRVSVLRLQNGQASTLKSASLLRYPESYSQIQVQSAASAKEGESEDEKKTAKPAPAPAPAYPVKTQAGHGFAITGPTPQDFTVQELGLTLQVTPVISDDAKSVSLDLKPKRVTLDAASGETSESGTDYPAQPRFSVWTTEQKLTVRRGIATLLAEIPPAPLAKDRRTVFIFVRAD